MNRTWLDQLSSLYVESFLVTPDPERYGPASGPDLLIQAVRFRQGTTLLKMPTTLQPDLPKSQHKIDRSPWLAAARVLTSLGFDPH